MFIYVLLSRPSEKLVMTNIPTYLGKLFVNKIHFNWHDFVQHISLRPNAEEFFLKANLAL